MFLVGEFGLPKSSRVKHHDTREVKPIESSENQLVLVTLIGFS